MESVLDEKIPGSKYFKWREVLWLPHWGVFAIPSDDQKGNLCIVINRLEIIRERFGIPIFITSALRPGTYNQLIGGADDSQHKIGLAVDFIVQGFSGPDGCAAIRKTILPWLSELRIRMENVELGSWIHIDCKACPDEKRYFRP